MTTLADIELEIASVLAVADELPEDQQEVALEHLEQLGLDESNKADAIGYAVRKRQSEIQFLKDEEERIRSRRKAIENRLASFKTYLTSIFERQGITKIKGLKSTLYLRSSSSVEIEDVNALPSDLVETKVEFRPRKKEIKEQLSAGVEVPGAQITSKQSLVVK